MPLDLTQLNYVDLAIIAIILVSFVWGLAHGFVKELFGLIGWVAALVLAHQFSPLVSEHLIEIVALKPDIALGLAALAIIVVVKFAVGLLAFLLNSTLKRPGISLINRLLGAIFGLARGGVIVVIMLMLVKEVKPIQQQLLWQESQLIPYFLTYESWLDKYVVSHRPRSPQS